MLLATFVQIVGPPVNNWGLLTIGPKKPYNAASKKKKKHVNLPTIITAELFSI